MKLYHKILLGFLVGALLVAADSYVSLSLHKSVKHSVLQLTQSSAKELDNAARMALALQTSQGAIQELMEEYHSLVAGLQDEIQVRAAISLAERDIAKSLFDVKLYLDRSREATTLGQNQAREAGEDEETEEESEELEWLDTLEEAFHLYEAHTNEFILLAASDIHRADSFLEAHLEPQYREILLPLIEQYWHDARHEFEHEEEEIQDGIGAAGRMIMLAAFIAVLFAIVFGLLLARHIARPLARLAEAAQAIGKGQAQGHLNVQSQDEVGHLAATFNQMIDDLSQTMVSKAYVDNIIESMADSLVVINVDGQIRHVNQATLNLLDFKKEDLEGQQVARIFGWAEAEVDRLINRLKEHKYVANEEAIYRTKTGKKIPVSFSGALMQAANDRVLGIVCVAKDITERKKFEAELIDARNKAEKMVRLKNSFIDNMSHEIRTPLQGILGVAQILRDEATDEQLEFTALLEMSSERLLNTINSVLDLARIEAGELKPALEPLHVVAETEQVVQTLRPLAEGKGLHLDLQITTEEAFALLDRGCLDRILTNVIGNAIKFTDAGKVSVEVGSDQEAVWLYVRDTGTGIDKNFLPHLFDSFKQESSGHTRKHEGNGLGLTITKNLVDMMNGEITVESIKGLGSCFTLRFPRVDPSSDALLGKSALLRSEAHDRWAINGQSPEPKSPGTAPQILLVEDTAATVAVVKVMLKAYEVEAAMTPEEALDLAKRRQFDLLLIDINLKADLSGVDVLRMLRTMPAYAETPAIAVTAYAMPGDRKRFLKAGFDGYVNKPFLKKHLLGIIEPFMDTEVDEGMDQGTFSEASV